MLEITKQMSEFRLGFIQKPFIELYYPKERTLREGGWQKKGEAESKGVASLGVSLL